MFKKILSQWENKKNLHMLLLLLFAGIGIMLLSSFLTPSKPTLNTGQEDVKTSSPAPRSTIKNYEQECEQQLSDVLSKIVGVDDVSIIINFDSDEVVEFATEARDSNQVTNELDKSGGNRSVTQTNTDKKIAHYRNNNNDLPVIVKRVKPKVRGVLVVARGVENLEIKAVVLEAVQRTLDVPLHRISVLPKG